MTIALPPFDIGKMGVQHAKWLITKEKPVPARTVMPVSFITK
jgi:ABC-type sugar transport system substrate-binding protein